MVSVITPWSGRAINNAPSTTASTALSSDHQKPGMWRLLNIAAARKNPPTMNSQPTSSSISRVKIFGSATASMPRKSMRMPWNRKSFQWAWMTSRARRGTASRSELLGSVIIIGLCSAGWRSPLIPPVGCGLSLRWLDRHLGCHRFIVLVVRQRRRIFKLAASVQRIHERIELWLALYVRPPGFLLMFAFLGHAALLRGRGELVWLAIGYSTSLRRYTPQIRPEPSRWCPTLAAPAIIDPRFP